LSIGTKNNFRVLLEDAKYMEEKTINKSQIK